MAKNNNNTENLNEVLNNLAPEETEVCKICGSPDIELRMWVKINSNEITSSCDDNETYCNGCEEIIRLADVITMAEYDEEKVTEEN